MIKTTSNELKVKFKPITQEDKGKIINQLKENYITIPVYEDGECISLSFGDKTLADVDFMNFFSLNAVITMYIVISTSSGSIQFELKKYS
ncbi:MAG TPA: hypothetical protein VL443_08190 [Cyclobacteriaceae bacterium]|jgi:hypothetical protein|nr:hypothetical protein [Cyclobacteriaceae bacterium]